MREMIPKKIGKIDFALMAEGLGKSKMTLLAPIRLEDCRIGC